MNRINHQKSLPIFLPAIAKYLVPGAIVALLSVSFVLVRKERANPECGKIWMITPLIIVPLAGTADNWIKAVDPMDAGLEFNW